MAQTKRTLIGSISNAASALLVFLVRLYQKSFGHVLGGSCRFSPSCSNYAIEALHTHGPIRGSWLTVRRICRCHPFGGSGDDPVPDPVQRSTAD